MREKRVLVALDTSDVRWRMKLNSAAIRLLDSVEKPWTPVYSCIHLQIHRKRPALIVEFADDTPDRVIFGFDHHLWNAELHRED